MEYITGTNTKVTRVETKSPPISTLPGPRIVVGEAVHPDYEILVPYKPLAKVRAYETHSP